MSTAGGTTRSVRSARDWATSARLVHSECRRRPFRKPFEPLRSELGTFPHRTGDLLIAGPFALRRTSSILSQCNCCAWCLVLGAESVRGPLSVLGRRSAVHARAPGAGHQGRTKHEAPSTRDDGYTILKSALDNE